MKMQLLSMLGALLFISLVAAKNIEANKMAIYPQEIKNFEKSFGNTNIIPDLQNYFQISKDVKSAIVQNNIEAAQCLGCKKELDVNDKNVIRLAEKGFNILNSAGLQSHNPIMRRLVRVIKATKQVTRGVLYDLHVEYTIDSFPSNQLCKLTLYVKPGNDEPEVQSHDCYDNNDLDNEIDRNIWRKRRDISNNNSNQFLKQVGPEEMGQVKQMADFAMETLDEIDVDNEKQVVVAVDGAQKQLTEDGSGIMFYLTLRTTSTACKEFSPVNDECLQKRRFSGFKTCKVNLLRTWAPNSSPVNAHVVKSECVEQPLVKRARRHAKKESTSIPGQSSNINLDDPGVQEAAKFAVNAVSEGSGSKHKLGLFKVVSAQRQIVAGSLYTIKIQAAKTNCTKDNAAGSCNVEPSSAFQSDPDFNECEIKVWDKAWLTPRFEITKLKCSKPNVNQKLSRRRRDEDEDWSELEQIESRLGMAPFQKTEPEGPEEEYDPSEPGGNSEGVLYVVPEEDRIKYEAEIREFEERRKLIVETEPISITDPGVINAVNVAIMRFNSVPNSDYVLGVVELFNATVQNLTIKDGDGKMYRVRFHAAKTNCTKDDIANLTAGEEEYLNRLCYVIPETAHHEDPEYKECDCVVWHHKWLEYPYDISIGCNRRKGWRDYHKEAVEAVMKAEAERIRKQEEDRKRREEKERRKGKGR